MNTTTVRPFRIVGTTTTVFEAWEPGDPMTTHSAITFVDGQCLGQIRSRALPTEIEEMPFNSPERIVAAQTFQAACKAEAVRLILSTVNVDENDPKVRIADGRVEVTA